jgi:hypothetical protein
MTPGGRRNTTPCSAMEGGHRGHGGHGEEKPAADKAGWGAVEGGHGLHGSTTTTLTARPSPSFALHPRHRNAPRCSGISCFSGQVHNVAASCHEHEMKKLCRPHPEHSERLCARSGDAHTYTTVLGSRLLAR